MKTVKRKKNDDHGAVGAVVLITLNVLNLNDVYFPTSYFQIYVTNDTYKLYMRRGIICIIQMN